MVQVETETFYSPPEQQVTTALGITSILKINVCLLPQNLFSTCGPFSPQVPFLPLKSTLQVIYFQYLGFIFYKHLYILLIYYFKATGIAHLKSSAGLVSLYIYLQASSLAVLWQ